jgi:hypothetical protein
MHYELLTKWAKSTATEKAGRERRSPGQRGRAKVNGHASGKAGIPELFRAGHRAERVWPEGVLAEGEELSPNPLRRVFNGLRTTQIAVDVV